MLIRLNCRLRPLCERLLTDRQEVIAGCDNVYPWLAQIVQKNLRAPAQSVDKNKSSCPIPMAIRRIAGWAFFADLPPYVVSPDARSCSFSCLGTGGVLIPLMWKNPVQRMLEKSFPVFKNKFSVVITRKEAS